MPKSKRDKKLSLTQTKKKGHSLKEKLINEVRDCIDKYARIFILSFDNMRNNKLKDVRQEWKDSRFFIGKNKVMAIALGQNRENESRENLHRLSKKLSGQMVVLFTNRSRDDVVEYFQNYHEADFARSGNVATQTVRISAGPLGSFPHSMEPQLRQLGLPTLLQKGVINLSKEYVVCKKGDTLTPEQTRVLKLFGHQMADFNLTVEGFWQNGKFESLKKITRHKIEVPADVTINATDIAPNQTGQGTVSVTKKQLKKANKMDTEEEEDACKENRDSDEDEADGDENSEEDDDDGAMEDD